MINVNENVESGQTIVDTIEQRIVQVFINFYFSHYLRLLQIFEPSSKSEDVFFFLVFLRYFLSRE